MEAHNVVYHHQPLIFSAFQESFCNEVLVLEHESHLLLIMQPVLWQHIRFFRLLWENNNV